MDVRFKKLSLRIENIRDAIACAISPQYVTFEERYKALSEAHAEAMGEIMDLKEAHRAIQLQCEALQEVRDMAARSIQTLKKQLEHERANARSFLAANLELMQAIRQQVSLSCDHLNRIDQLATGDIKTQEVTHE